MSNYLDYLAARSLNLTSGIQPRLPGLFEPFQADDGIEWTDPMNGMEMPGNELVAHSQQIPWSSHSPIDPITESPTLDGTASLSSDTLPRPHPQAAPAPESLVQPSRQLESILPDIQTPGLGKQGSIRPPEIGPLHLISPLKAPAFLDRSFQQEDSLLMPLLLAGMPTSPLRPEEHPGAIHSLISRSQKQEEIDDSSLSSPERMEAKLILESARAQVQVEPSLVRQIRSGAAIASPKQTSARLNKIKRVVLPATSTEKHDPQPPLFESRTETVESPIPSLMAAGSVTVRPSIKAAHPAGPGMPQKSASVSVQQTESLPEPVVHVTIGRIEVRAAPPMQPKRETQAKLSAIGLDEYLKQFGSKR